MSGLSLAALVNTSDLVASTTRRKEKTGALAELLTGVEPAEADQVVSILAGNPLQGRIGVGWATISALTAQRATSPTLDVSDLHHLLDAVAATSGAGSGEARRALLNDFLQRCTPSEGDFVIRLLLGELRQGANEGLVVDGLAKAAGVPAALVRRALMLSGQLGTTAAVALGSGRNGLEAIRLEVMRPLRPMLAATAESVPAALDAVGAASVEWKLDGARIQVHKSGTVVRVWTRNLNEVTDRVPMVTSSVRSLRAERLVLDGEVLGIDDDDRPQAFQATMSEFGSESARERRLEPFFFDLIHLDGEDLLDRRLEERLDALDDTVGRLRVPGMATSDATSAAGVLDDALAHGHEGVMVKALDAPYEAGRRGKAWRKVKPVHTLDLVVLAVEWGHGRRTGTLSNLHLGARSADRFVMVGKTFKGLTDELLAWQTKRFLELETHRQGNVVHVRPEQVVEVALDGVQSSSRYPGGVALRFARVRSYRHDKVPSEADTIDAVRALLPGRP